MDTIGEDKIISYDAKGAIKQITCFKIRRDKACLVKNYMDLATRIATLQFNNPSHMLLFRGQRSDHKRTNKSGVKYTTLPPSLFRDRDGVSPSSNLLRERFELLKRSEEELVLGYRSADFPKPERLERQRILRWSILQHYEICQTPLLDVSQSLRIAASFASEGAEKQSFVFVLGVPNISGAITASAETGLQIVRLSGVCPPSAVRPHIQEGYLLGEYPEMFAYNQKALYGHYEIDFGRRLVAKFRFNPKTFWRDAEFPRVKRNALYPNRNDPLFSVARTIKETIGDTVVRA